MAGREARLVAGTGRGRPGFDALGNDLVRSGLFPIGTWNRHATRRTKLAFTGEFVLTGGALEHGRRLLHRQGERVLWLESKTKRERRQAGYLRTANAS